MPSSPSGGSSTIFGISATDYAKLIDFVVSTEFYHKNEFGKHIRKARISGRFSLINSLNLKSKPEWLTHTTEAEVKGTKEERQAAVDALAGDLRTFLFRLACYTQENQNDPKIIRAVTVFWLDYVLSQDNNNEAYQTLLEHFNGVKKGQFIVMQKFKADLRKQVLLELFPTLVLAVTANPAISMDTIATGYLELQRSKLPEELIPVVLPYYVPQKLPSATETLTEDELKQFFFTDLRDAITTNTAPSNDLDLSKEIAKLVCKFNSENLSILESFTDGDLDATKALEIAEQFGTKYAQQARDILQRQKQPIPSRSSLSIPEVKQLVASADIASCKFTPEGLVQHSDQGRGWIQNFFQKDEVVRTQTCIIDLQQALESHNNGTLAEPISAIERAQAGRRFTRADFVLLAKLGAGSYGVLFAAHLNPKSFPYLSEEACKSIRVALKFEFLPDGKDFVTNFCRPLQILSTDSPYLLDNLGYFSCVVTGEKGKSDSLCAATIMPLGSGSLEDRRITLQKARSSKCISMADLAFYKGVILDVLKGLQALHGQNGEGNIHRDVKSANVLLMPTGDGTQQRAVLCDYGTIRSAMGEKETVPEDVGSPAFQAPEVKANQVYDHRADFWAVGVMTYEFITGQIPSDDDLKKCTSKADRIKFIQNRFKKKFYQFLVQNKTLQEWVHMCAKMMQHNMMDRGEIEELIEQAKALNSAFPKQE